MFGHGGHPGVVTRHMQQRVSMLRRPAGEKHGIPAFRRAVDGCGHFRPEPCSAASFIARSIGLSA